MEKSIYVIRDRVAGQNGPSFEAYGDEKARRQVWQLLRKVVPYDRDSFSLIRVGTYVCDGLDFDFQKEMCVVDIDIPKFNECEEQGLLDFAKEEK